MTLAAFVIMRRQASRAGGPIWRLLMRTILAALIAAPVILAGAGTANAQNYPWCAHYNLRGGAVNCGFVTYAQCQATVSGIGGFCQRNPMFVPPQSRRTRYRVY
jgi:hypothetical protein